MKKTTKISPRNSLILIMDQSIGQVPESMDGQLVSANETCIAVGTLSEFDGETEIILTNERYTASEDDVLVYDGILKISSGELSVCSVLDDALIKMQVNGNCSLRIYVNDNYEPDRITIVIGKCI